MSQELCGLADWLSRIELLHPAQIELGLDRVGEVATRMGLMHPRATVITVAGTNGKGSCVAAMEAVLLANGERVAAYTSPHLLRYNERVRIQGVEADDESLCRAFARVEQARGEISLTYFEFGTLAALDLFRESGAAFLLLEVGLGGRLDAVNILDADVALISSIQIDHTDWLGTDRESIGREKAGIFRQARPVVCAERDPPATLRARAVELACPWYAIDEQFAAGERPGERWCWRAQRADGSATGQQGLPAPHLLDSNIAAALQALLLCGVDPAAALRSGALARLAVAGRNQRKIFGAGECVLDVAHNPAALELLVARLGAVESTRRVPVLFGAMSDKDLPAMLARLAPLAERWYLPQLPEARAATAEQLGALLHSIAPAARVQCCAGVAEALQAARAEHGAGECLLVCGSFHVVGPALEWFEQQERNSGEQQ